MSFNTRPPCGGLFHCRSLTFHCREFFGVSSCRFTATSIVQMQDMPVAQYLVHAESRLAGKALPFRRPSAAVVTACPPRPC